MKMKGVIMPTSSTGGGGDGVVAAPLQRVANRPIVCHVLEELLSAGIREVAIVSPSWCLTELQESIAAEGPADVEVAYAPHGGDGSLEPALHAVGELIGDSPCVVHAPDGLLTQPLADLLSARTAAPSADLVAFVHPSPGGSTALSTHRLMRLVEQLPVAANAEDAAEESSLQLAGVCVFGAGALRRVAAERWWRGDGLDLAAVCERFLEVGAMLSVEVTSGWLQYRGSTNELLALNRFLLDALVGDGPMMAVRGSNRIEGPVLVHPTAVVQSSTIVGPALIGPHAQVVGSYIGPYTSIGAGAHIEGAEVERSIILSGARITHIGGRLVGSVVGRDAHIFRDFSLPRAMRLNVGDGGEVALC
jgi:glucose-1-phosphate thymidylyltransferase